MRITVRSGYSSLDHKLEGMSNWSAFALFLLLETLAKNHIGTMVYQLRYI